MIISEHCHWTVLMLGLMAHQVVLHIIKNTSHLNAMHTIIVSHHKLSESHSHF